MAKLESTDEYAHQPSERPDWRESYYFNWVDLENDISGFTTIGLLPNARKREFVFAIFHKDLQEIHYLEPDEEVPSDFHESLTNGILSYEIVKPLEEWRIRYEAKKVTAEISWKGRFPAYDFGFGSGTSWSGHFEQSGIVTGEVGFEDASILNFKGLGERDKSWGARDWHIESWYALHAQFKDISIGLRRDIVDGTPHSSGGISTVDSHVPITKVELQTEYIDEKMPAAAETKVFGEDGSCYTLKSRIISDYSFVRFAREFSAGTTELWEEMAIHECEELGETGTGLLEWLFTFPK